MPHITVQLWSGKSEEQKKRLADALVKAAISVIGYSEDSFSVAIQDIEPKNWKEEVYDPEIAAKTGLLYKNPGYKMD